MSLLSRHFSSPIRHTLSGSAGDVGCLQAVSETRRGVVECLCYASESGMVTGLEGATSDVKDFYFMVSSVRTIQRK